jgi:hypothetical protein
LLIDEPLARDRCSIFEKRNGSKNRHC